MKEVNDYRPGIIEGFPSSIIDLSGTGVVTTDYINNSIMGGYAWQSLSYTDLDDNDVVWAVFDPSKNRGINSTVVLPPLFSCSAGVVTVEFYVGVKGTTTYDATTGTELSAGNLNDNYLHKEKLSSLYLGIDEPTNIIEGSKLFIGSHSTNQTSGGDFKRLKHIRTANNDLVYYYKITNDSGENGIYFGWEYVFFEFPRDLKIERVVYGS